MKTMDLLTWMTISMMSASSFFFSEGLDFPLMSSSACYSTDLPCTSHHLQCPTGSVITIMTAHYGYKQQCQSSITCSKCCWYSEGDCLIEYNPKHYQMLFKSCSLQKECIYEAPWVASTLCSRYQGVVIPSLYSYITYRCNEGMGNADKIIPAITPVKGEWNSKTSQPDKKIIQNDKVAEDKQGRDISQIEREDKGLGLGTLIVTIVCSILLLILLIIIGVLVKLGYCSKLDTKLNCRKQIRKNGDEEPEYYECEEVCDVVPDVISNSLYSQPYERASSSRINPLNVQDLNSLYAKPLKKTKKLHSEDHHFSSSHDRSSATSSKDRSNQSSTPEGCYYLKSNLLTPYESDVIPGSGDYAFIGQDKYSSQEDCKRLNPYERVSTVSGTSSDMVNYDRLKFNTPTSGAELDPNYDHLRCCGYDLKSCKRFSRHSQNDRKSKVSKSSSCDSNYEKINEIHFDIVNAHSGTKLSPGQFKNTCGADYMCISDTKRDTMNRDPKETKHPNGILEPYATSQNFCRCGSEKEIDRFFESDECDDNVNYCKVSTDESRITNCIGTMNNNDIQCDEGDCSKDNETICSFIDNEYSFCYNDDIVDNDNEYYSYSEDNDYDMSAVI